jgi:hypothetical protein
MLAGHDHLVEAGVGGPLDVLVLFEVVGLASAAFTRMVAVDASVGAPFQKTSMSSVWRPGSCSRAIWAAISPVVYIWATPGDRTRPALANSCPYFSSHSIIQSCSPVVSV